MLPLLFAVKVMMPVATRAPCVVNPEPAFVPTPLIMPAAPAAPAVTPIVDVDDIASAVPPAEAVPKVIVGVPAVPLFVIVTDEPVIVVVPPPDVMLLALVASEPITSGIVLFDSEIETAPALPPPLLIAPLT